MNDPCLVRHAKSACDLLGYPYCFANAKLAALDQRAQRLALDKLADDVMRAINLPDLVNSQDVRMIGRARRRRLALEAEQPFVVIRELRRQQLERDPAMQPFVFGQIYLAHPASAQQ